MGRRAKTTIDRFGRILIPKPIRRALGLAPGTRIRIEASGEELTLTAEPSAPSLIEEEGVLVFSGASAGDMEDALRDEREERLAELVTRTGLR
ncbi:MAG: AbrB/MazE/SpoVT family DNA-binding domain-containing protein [Deltaproteobacteria bacterium]|nr:AbrB/MazE/SpoVT family DNA-binding domain-containing protein [Deltaproteobacteria bacterium]